MSIPKQEDTFKLKELCWAKIKGYPWWPGIIRNIYNLNGEEFYFVAYLCENNGSVLNRNAIKKWESNYELFREGKTNSKNGKGSTINNDFKSALAVAILYCEGKINDVDHDKFLNKYQTNKDRHNIANIESFFNNIIQEKLEKEKEKEKNKKEELINKNTNKEIKNKTKNKSNKKKLIGKKRNLSKAKPPEKQEKKSVIKDNEINMTQKELNKIDDLISNITYNIDEIMIKSEKYQKFFSKECKEKNICIHDNKSIKTKIELIKYLQIMNDILNVPINLNKMILNINSKNS